MRTSGALGAIFLLALLNFSASADELSNSSISRLRVLVGMTVQQNNMSSSLIRLTKSCGMGTGGVAVTCDDKGTCCRVGVQLWCCSEGHSCNYDEGGCN
jgi:hypothetical protein